MFEDTTGVVRSHISKKYRQYYDQKKNGQTMIYKTPHRKPKNEQYEPH
jgi:hypothetical protein